ncbi:Transmembrane protein [Phocaeicola vulgatus]
MVAADSGSRSFTVSVCFVLVLVFRFLIFSLSGFPALFHRKSCHVSPFPPFAFCYPFLRCSSLRYRPSVFRSLFYALLFFHIIMYAHVCGCGDAASFASLPSVFSLFLFSVCYLRMGPFLFPSLYARANIIMCLSFSSGVLRYKNMLCNTSVIQSITKKFQEIRIIFPSYVCWLSLKGLPLHPQSREMRHFRQCVTDLVKQT